MKGLIFTYVMTYGGSAVAVFNPFVGLLIYCCFAIVRPEAMWHWSVPQGGNYSRIIAISVLVGWVLKGMGEWNFGRAKSIVLSFTFYIAWAVMATMFASGQLTQWKFIDDASKYFIPWFVGVTTIRSFKQVNLLAWTLMLSQAYVALEANMNWVYGDREVLKMGFAGLDNNAMAIGMVTAAGLAFFLGMTTSSTKLRWTAFASAGLMAHYPMFAESRGGMVALVVVAVVSFVLLPKQRQHYTYFLLAVLVAFRLAGPMVWDRFNTSFEGSDNLDFSAQSRLDLWSDALDMMQRFPLFGVGPDNFGIVATEYGWPLGKECHSLWLQTGAELGIMGLAFLSAFYFLTISKLWRFIHASDTIIDPQHASLARAIIASLVGFIVSAQFVTIEGLELPYYVVMAAVGLLKVPPTVAASSPPIP